MRVVGVLGPDLGLVQRRTNPHTAHTAVVAAVPAQEEDMEDQEDMVDTVAEDMEDRTKVQHSRTK